MGDCLKSSFVIHSSLHSVNAGIIAIWEGALVDVPSGWAICDGDNGTPDLRDRFVIGAGATYDPDDTGGSATHTHLFSSNAHNHTLVGGAFIDGGNVWSAQVDNAVATGVTDQATSLRPYYALAYIMKL